MTRPARIAYLSSTTSFFGAEHSLLETINSLDRERFVPHLITLEAGPLGEAARNQGITVHRLPWLRADRGPFLRFFMMTCRFAWWLRKERIRLVILSFYLPCEPIDLGALVLATHLAGAKFIFRHRMCANWWLSLYEKFWLGCTDGILAVTKAAIMPWLRPRRSDLLFRIQPTRIRIVPSSRNIGTLSTTIKDRACVRSLGVPDHVRLVGMVAAIDPRKRQDIFLQAAAVIHQHDPSVWFLVVGGPYESGTEAAFYEQSLRALIQGNGLAHRVIFTGYRGDVPNLLRNLDVFVLPTQQEALGGVLIEAMACGVPVVASRVDGIPEIVKDHEAGLLIPSDDPKDYAAAVLKLLDDRELARRMGEFGKRWAMQFDSARVTRLLEQCYEEVFDSNAHRQRRDTTLGDMAHA